ADLDHHLTPAAVLVVQRLLDAPELPRRLLRMQRATPDVVGRRTLGRERRARAQAVEQPPHGAEAEELIAHHLLHQPEVAHAPCSAAVARRAERSRTTS